MIDKIIQQWRSIWGMADLGRHNEGKPSASPQQTCGGDQERRPGRRKTREIRTEPGAQFNGPSAAVAIETLTTDERRIACCTVKALGGFRCPGKKISVVNEAHGARAIARRRL